MYVYVSPESHVVICTYAPGGSNLLEMIEIQIRTYVHEQLCFLSAVSKPVGGWGRHAARCARKWSAAELPSGAGRPKLAHLSGFHKPGDSCARNKEKKSTVPLPLDTRALWWPMAERFFFLRLGGSQEEDPPALGIFLSALQG